jgi:uncharacterized protein (TIGR00159 family)
MQGLTPSTIAHSIRWQDAVDVLVLTLLFSRLYTWLKHTVAVQIAFGLFTLVLASWVANHFGLILTSYLLSAVGAVATVVIAIVFQHEIRQGLTRVSALRWLTERRGQHIAGSMATTIAQAAFSLARRGKGALIVIPRRDSVAEHLTAGTAIEGRLSSALIEAIFTSTSSLHDGAIVVGRNRLSRAGVILPLATDSAAADSDDDLGTRHRAALGLTDNCDALVVCVSEERGAVSLVHGETLQVLADEAALVGALARLGVVGGLSKAEARQLRPPFRLQQLGPHLAPHLMILAIVVVGWAAMALDRSHAVARVLPLEIRGVGEGVAFDPPRFASVVVELRGSRRELEALPVDAAAAFIDLSGATPGPRSFRVQTQAPAGIEVVNTSPASIQLQLRPRGAPSARDDLPPPVGGAPALRGRAPPPPLRH